MKQPIVSTAAVLGLSLFLGACGGADAAAEAPGHAAVAAGAPTAAAAPAAAQPAPATGNVIEVQMVSGGSERFEPSTITARPGDVVRFVLVSGVHNVSFPAAQNPGGVALPATSAYFQAPGQTHDVPVDLPAGEYRFQCDPHALMGMVGTLTVTE